MANNTPEPLKVSLTEMDRMEIKDGLTKAERTRRFVVGLPWGSNFIEALAAELTRFGFVVGDDPFWVVTGRASIIVTTTVERLAEVQEEARRLVASEDWLD